MDLFDPEYLLFFSCAAKCDLRYLIIGGYAVNYYGYLRNTHDLDIWLAPTNENRDAFINTLLCMNYSESEVEPLRLENFTEHYIGTMKLFARKEKDLLDISELNKIKKIRYLKA